MFHKKPDPLAALGVELPAPKGLRRFDRGGGVILTTVDTRGPREIIVDKPTRPDYMSPYVESSPTCP